MAGKPAQVFVKEVNRICTKLALPVDSTQVSSSNRHYLCCSIPFPREKKAEIAAIAITRLLRFHSPHHVVHLSETHKYACPGWWPHTDSRSSLYSLSSEWCAHKDELSTTLTGEIKLTVWHSQAHSQGVCEGVYTPPFQGSTYRIFGLPWGEK